MPLAHTALSVPVLQQIEAHYQQRHRPTVFRLPEGLITAQIGDALHAMGYSGNHGVLVQVAELAGLLRLAPPEAAALSASPSTPWASVYTADGFDPVDGALGVAFSVAASPGAMRSRAASSATCTRTPWCGK